jgi:hypothetical protein
MLLLKTLVITFLLIPFVPLQAVLNDSAITVRLQQAVDANCDGIHDNAFSSTDLFIILPQQCVIYKISVHNLSSQSVSDVLLTGKIPQYAQLKPNGTFIYKNGKLQSATIYQSVNSIQVKARLITLAPSETIDMIYSVLIN